MEGDDDLAQALAAFQRGALDRARSLAEAALRRTPDAPALLHLLGLIECRAGNMQSGVEWLRSAVGAEPANIPVRVMLIRALVDSGRAVEALETAARPRGAGPGQLALWHARAEAADAASEAGAAAEAWQVLCAAQPDDWRAWINLGRSLLGQSRFADAGQAYGKALAIAPTNLAALRELGLIHQRTGEHQRLAQLLDGAEAAGIARPQLAELWAIRAERAGQYGDARALMLAVPPGERSVRWQRLRAKIADAAGDPAEAFAAAAAMNRAVAGYGEWRERAAATRRALRESADAITPEWAARLPRLGPAGTRAPAFLVGFPRSGTTLLDTFLMGHPAILVLEEQGLLRNAAQAMGPIAALDRLPAEAAARIRANYFALLDQHSPDPARGVTIDKAPLNMLLTPLIDCLFGDVPILFVRRHPCDAVLSAFMQAFEPNLGMASFLDLADAADFYDAAMRVWTASRDVLPLNVREVAYEALVEDPEAVLRPAVAFLGLEWDERLLDHRLTAKARGVIMNTSHDQVTEPLHTRAAGRWRRYRQQLEPVLPILLPWAQRLGYSED